MGGVVLVRRAGDRAALFFAAQAAHGVGEHAPVLAAGAAGDEPARVVPAAAARALAAAAPAHLRVDRRGAGAALVPAGAAVGGEHRDFARCAGAHAGDGGE